MRQIPTSVDREETLNKRAMIKLDRGVHYLAITRKTFTRILIIESSRLGEIMKQYTSLERGVFRRRLFIENGITSRDFQHTLDDPREFQ